VCEDLAERLENGGWQVVNASRKRARLLRLADMVLTVLRHRREYSVAQVDVFSGPAFFWAETVCWNLQRLRKPYVLTVHGGNLPAFATRWPRRVKRLLCSAKAVSAPSGYLKGELEAYCHQIKVIPNAIDIGLYRSRERAPAKPKLVWLRAFHEIYNPVMAVEVAAALARDFPEVELSMIGPDRGDGSMEKVKAEIRKLKLEERICLQGAVEKEDVPSVLAKGDVFLNTSNVDNTPVSLIEAMATGMCIVTTEVGGVPYLCENGKEALLVPRNDAEAMSYAVRSILVDSALSGCLSRAARAKAKRFDWSEVLPKWEKLLGQFQNAEAPQNALRGLPWNGQARPGHRLTPP